MSDRITYFVALNVRTPNQRPKWRWVAQLADQEDAFQLARFYCAQADAAVRPEHYCVGSFDGNYLFIPRLRNFYSTDARPPQVCTLNYLEQDATEQTGTWAS